MPASVGIELSPTQRRILLERARASIEHGARMGRLMPVDTMLPGWLQAPAATFVRLTLRSVGDGAGANPSTEQLRGCIGSLQAYRSLAEDVNENAYAAAFRDPRFPPVAASELALLRIELAVLSTPQPLPPATSDEDLLERLVVGRDGVVLNQHGRRATFLPKVWSHFDKPSEFLAALRQKAGLSATFDPHAQYSTYQVESFAEC